MLFLRGIEDGVQRWEGAGSVYLSIMSSPLLSSRGNSVVGREAFFVVILLRGMEGRGGD